MPIDPRAWRMHEDKGRDSLEAQVKRLLGEFGLHGYHTRNSLGSQPGFPDWVIWGRDVMFRELKSQRGTLNIAQRVTGSQLKKADGDWSVWQPADYYDGTIQRQLEMIAWH